MKKKLILIAASATLFTAGCEKKLDIQNPNSPTSEVIFTTADYAQKGVNAIYSTLHRVGLSRMQFFMNIIRSDEGLSASPNANLINNFDIFNVTDYNFFETGVFTRIVMWALTVVTRCLTMCRILIWMQH